jgi:hypothetical protein
VTRRPAALILALAAALQSLRERVEALEPCCDDAAAGGYRAMCQHGSYVEGAVLTLIDEALEP